MAQDEKSRNIPLFIVLFTLLIVISLIIAVYSFSYFFASRKYAETSSNQSISCSSISYEISKVSYVSNTLSFVVKKKSGDAFSSLIVFTQDKQDTVLLQDTTLVPEQKVALPNVVVFNNTFGIMPGVCEKTMVKRVSLLSEN